jgi:hypothetical protein
MAEKQLTPAQARALIRNMLNDGYRASQVKNVEKVKSVLSKEQIEKTIDKTLKGSTVAKDARPMKPTTGSTRIGGLAGGARGAMGAGMNWQTK